MYDAGLKRGEAFRTLYTNMETEGNIEADGGQTRLMTGKMVPS